jgi:hypothetical protein
LITFALFLVAVRNPLNGYPPTTKLQAHLLILADALEQQATLARECAQPAAAMKLELNGRNGHHA